MECCPFQLRHEGVNILRTFGGDEDDRQWGQREMVYILACPKKAEMFVFI